MLSGFEIIILKINILFKNVVLTLEDINYSSLFNNNIFIRHEFLKTDIELVFGDPQNF